MDVFGVTDELPLYRPNTRIHGLATRGAAVGQLDNFEMQSTARQTFANALLCPVGWQPSHADQSGPGFQDQNVPAISFTLDRRVSSCEAAETVPCHSGT